MVNGFLFLFLTLLSCQKESNFYSCNPTLNEWATQNFTSISKMSYGEIAEYSNVEQQRTIFRTLNPTLKIQFWEDRLNDILKLNWTTEEQNHIVELLDIIRNNGYRWFEGKINSKTEEEKEFIQNDFEIKTYKWKEYAIEKLGWSQEVLFSVIAMPSRVLDTKGSLAIETRPFFNNSTVKTRSESKPDCECSLDSDWCSGRRTCQEDECTRLPVGFLPDACGTLLYYDCDGMCK